MFTAAILFFIVVVGLCYYQIWKDENENEDQ